MYTMVLSITHRITGVVLSLGSVLLVYWLWAVSSGATQYEQVRECMGAVWVKFLVIGLLFSFFYHLCNGVRHLVWDLGYGLERPQARASGWTVVVVSLALTVAAAVLALRVLGNAV
jgi:succinate dehydrogenase / fumarate reductase, cytochrome b subunit